MEFDIHRRSSTLKTCSSLLVLSMITTLLVLGSPVMAQDSDGAATEPAGGSGDQDQDVEAIKSEARKAMSASNWQKAINLWSEVLVKAPGDQEATKGLADAQSAMDQGSTIDAVDNDIQLRQQRARVEFESARDQATQKLSEGDYTGANQAIITAKVRLNREQKYLNPNDYQSMIKIADTLIDQISEAKILSQLAQQEIQQQQATDEKNKKQRVEMEERQRSINQSLLRVRKLQMELKYEEALQVIEEILFIDEYNPAALALRDVIQTSILYRTYSDMNRDRAFAHNHFVEENMAATIPPKKNLSGPGPRSISAIMSYPEDWPELSIRRDAAAGYRESDANRKAMMELNKVISVDFDNNEFEQVVNYMQRVTGLEIYPDWKALDSIGIAQDDSVTLKLGEISASNALGRILEQLGDELDPVEYSIEDGIVVISSEQALRKKLETIVYDIRDLLFEVPYFDNAPNFSLQGSISQGGGGGGGQGGGGGGGGGFGGGGGGGFGGGGGGSGGGGGGGGGFLGDPGEEPERKDREELIEQIVTIIQEQVDPDGWRDLGGDTGTLQELNGNLIITNTAKNHREIEGLLSQLREIRALQINIEGRLITVQTEWFEMIGMDLDIYFNTNEEMWGAARQANPNFQLSDFFWKPTDPNYAPNEAGTPLQGQFKDPILFTGYGPSNPATTGNTLGGVNTIQNPADPTGVEFQVPPGGYGAPVGLQKGQVSPIGITQNTLDLVITQASGLLKNTFGGAALANPAMAVGLSFLDDVQIDLLVNATQADQRNVVLTAPRLTLFNGQRSWISVAKAETYVSGLNPVTGDNAAAFEPETDVIFEGFVLDVEAVISADRRYVTMTVQFGLNENVELKPLVVQGAAGGGDAVGGGAGRSSVFQGTIQLPQLQGTQIATTVSVPDKGTILLGGQRLVDELEIESGVPVLSKIPLVQRFFTNRVTDKREKTLLLLVRPEIIIQQEDEARLFPGLSDKVGTGSYLGY